MKLILFILSLTFLHMPSAQTGSWDLITIEDYYDRAYLEVILIEAVEGLTQQEVQAGRLPEATYQYSHIYSTYGHIYLGRNYRYDVDITNDQGWVIRATFAVYVRLLDEFGGLASYAYEVTTNPNLPSEEEEFILEENSLLEGWEEIDPLELNTDQQLSNAYSFGVEAITEQAINEHALPGSEYEVIQIHSIYSQVVSDMKYRFDISLQNCVGLVARAVFTVSSQPRNEILEAILVSFHITVIPRDGLTGGECHDIWQYWLAPEDPSLNREGIFEEENLGDYIPIDPEEAQNNADVQELLNFGANYVISTSGTLREPNYEISQVFSVERQIGSGVNYRFTVEVRGCGGQTARVEYIVYEEEPFGFRKVTWYSVEITGKSDGNTAWFFFCQ